MRHNNVHVHKDPYDHCSVSLPSCLSIMHLTAVLCAALVAAAASSVVPIQRKFDPRVFNSSAAGRARASATRGIDVCTGGGYECDAKCRTMGLCLSSGSGFTFRPTAECGSGYCTKDGNTVKCQDTLGSCQPNSEEIGCDTTGILPDPYNCQNVVSCFEGRVATSEPICSDDLEYDACTGYCDVPLKGGKCKGRGPLCKTLSTVDYFEENHRIYYYCTQDAEGLLHPVLGRCERGFFDKENFACVDSDIPGCLREGCGSGTVSGDGQP